MDIPEYVVIYHDVQGIPARYPIQHGVTQLPKHYLALKFNLQPGTIVVEQKTKDSNFKQTSVAFHVDSAFYFWILQILGPQVL